MFFETSPTSSLNSSSCSSGYSSSNDEFVEMTPTQLLALAIRKRRELYDRKERDYRRELHHTGMVKQLCRYLGAEGRAKRRSRKSRSRRRSASALGKRKLSEPSATTTGLEGIPLPPEPAGPESTTVQSLVVPPPPPPSMEMELDDAVPQIHAAADVNSLLDDAEEPEPKRAKLDDSDAPAAAAHDDNDPFGLDAFFAGLYAVDASNAAEAERTVPNLQSAVIEPSRG